MLKENQMYGRASPAQKCCWVCALLVFLLLPVGYKAFAQEALGSVGGTGEVGNGTACEMNNAQACSLSGATRLRGRGPTR
jgi:hypothetical protein